MKRGFEVEWCSRLPIDEFGGADLDNATIERKDFPNLGLARAYAKRVVDKTEFGVVEITPFELVPFEPGYPGMTREYTGETEHVEAE